MGLAAALLGRDEQPSGTQCNVLTQPVLIRPCLLAGEAPSWQGRHRSLAVGLAAAFLGRDGQPSGTLLHLVAAKASPAELKPVLLEMKTQAIPLFTVVPTASGYQDLCLEGWVSTTVRC